MIPSFIQPFLWSYDVEKLDIERDKKRIITNVLNLGTAQATKWLFGVYGREDIKETVANPLIGEWSKKSLNFWSIIFNIKSVSIGKRAVQQ